MNCPISKGCVAYQKGIQAIIPTPKKKIITDVYAAIAVIQKDKKIFIQKRPSHGLLADLWEFPGGKIERGETPVQAVRRELKEELGILVQSPTLIMNVRHFYTQFRVNLSVFSCQTQGFPRSSKFRKWVSFKELEHYPMPSGSVKVVKKLKALAL